MNALRLIVAAHLICASISAQVSAKPTFEVASVKNAAPNEGRNGNANQARGGGTKADGGRITYRDILLRTLLMRAYHLRSDQISGPSWLEEERYDLVAKIPEGAPPESVPVMLQNLLEERFRMSIRWESKQQAGYALSVDKNGPKLKASKEEWDSDTPGFEASLVAKSLQMTPDHVELTTVTMPAFASTLSSFIGRPVRDMTGLAGSFDITLNVSMKDLASLRQLSPGPDGVQDTASIFTAVRQLGLVLRPQKLTERYLVVEKAEKVPTEN